MMRAKGKGKYIKPSEVLSNKNENNSEMHKDSEMAKNIQNEIISEVMSPGTGHATYTVFRKISRQ